MNTFIFQVTHSKKKKKIYMLSFDLRIYWNKYKKFDMSLVLLSIIVNSS